MSDHYDQRKEDPQGYYASIAVLVGLIGIGLLVAGGELAPLGIAGLIGAAALDWRSRR